MKIREALSNAVLHKDPITNRLYAIGDTLDGICIKMHIEVVDNIVQITSAYPCKKWLLGV